MSLSPQALHSALDTLIETLQIYRKTGALSDYGQAKLGTVADLQGIRGSLLKVIQDEDPQRVWAKLQALYRKIFAAEFIAAPAGQKMAIALHQNLFGTAEPEPATPEPATPEPDPSTPADAAPPPTTTGVSDPATLATIGRGTPDLAPAEAAPALATPAATLAPTSLSPAAPAAPVAAPPAPTPLAADPIPTPPAPLTPAPATIAMVLLDADHFSLDRDREVYLQDKTHCQILYRVAFANWKNRGNDGDLHHRHYLLIHVPAGRDRTDGAMLTFGSSIRAHYPRVQQVFIGSNDQIFSSLATTLVQQGYAVYRITQQGDRVAVRDVVSGEIWEIPQPPVPLDVLHDRLIKLCQWLHRKAPWISLDQLAQAYENRHGSPFDRDLDDRLSELLPHQSNSDQASLLTFLQKSPHQFVLHQSPEQPDITWISLFAPPLLPQPAQGAAPANDSQTIFEQQLIPLIDLVLQKVPSKYPDGFVSLSEVTHEFRNTYQQGINTVCTELTGKRIGVFLQMAELTLLQAKKQGNKGWFLAKA